MANRSDIHSKAVLAAKFNEFYLQITSPEITQIGNYIITSDLGEGAFGKVYLATHILLNVQVVLKCGPKDDPNIVREIYYHSQLRHKHIVKLYEVIKTETNLWMALEYCEGNELYYHIYNSKRLDYKQCQLLFYQIMLGVAYVHLLNLCHRDLKLENILLADLKKTIIKLTDFGFVREFNPAKRSWLSTVCGTTVYMAPEMFNNLKYLGFAVDIWSLGIILYTMFYGELPFDEDDDLDNKYKIVFEEPNYREIIPKDAIELIKRMLTKDPKKRATLTEIMNSSFLQALHRKGLERANSSSSRRDTESILSINQHFSVQQQILSVNPNQPNQHLIPTLKSVELKGNQPFESKIEKNLLKAFKNLNVDLDQIKQNIIENKTNSLTAFYELALTREYRRKKQRYYHEKRKRYKEAKKSLKSSRKRVKSALSLNDMSGTQPLEKILSGLSISSRTKAGSMSGDRRSVVSMGREASQNGTITGMPPSLGHSSTFASTKEEGPSIGSISMAPSPKSSAPIISSGVNNGTPARRSVSFSNAPDQDSKYSEYKLDFTRRKRLIDKLQFWKKAGNDEIDDINEEKISIGNTISASGSEETTETHGIHDERSSNNNPRIKLTDMKRNEQFKGKSPELVESENSKSVSEKGDKAVNNNLVNSDTMNKNNIINNDNNINNVNGSVNIMNGSMNNTINNIKTSMVSSTSNGTSSPSPGIISREGSSYYRNKTRPSSVISQVSQLSHLSQLSTMISESELDILGETDTMDDFDYYDEDEDRLYESSINNSHSDLRYLATGMTPSSSYVSSNKRGMRKRPSYRRNMSSDMSIMSTSTSNTQSQQPPVAKVGGTSGKKNKLSHVSSASSISEQSSIRSNDNLIAPPQQLLENNATDSSPPPLINRSSSPLQLRAPAIPEKIIHRFKMATLTYSVHL